MHTWNNRELSLEEVPEGASSSFEVVAVLVHEVDGDVQGVLDISVEAKALLKHKRQDACSVWVDVCPDVAAPAEKACMPAATLLATFSNDCGSWQSPSTLKGVTKGGIHRSIPTTVLSWQACAQVFTNLNRTWEARKTS